MQEINNIIREGYGLIPKGIVQYRDSYIINTADGKKVFKKSDFSDHRIRFVHGAKEHLYRNGFTNIDRYILTKEASPCVRFNNAFYTLTDNIEGKECNFNNRKELSNASRTLALLHSTSKGYVVDNNSFRREELGKLPIYLNKRLKDIRKMKKISKNLNNKFDYALSQNVDYFYNLGAEVIESLSNSNYYKLVETARKEGSFCHHDYTHSNIICQKDKTYIINFESCSFELRVYDIANFLRRKMRKCNWDIDEAKLLIEEYNSISKLSDDEIYILKIMLKFPQKFWRIANRYYNSKKNCSQKIYLNYLEEVINEIKYHRNFINNFESIF